NLAPHGHLTGVIGCEHPDGVKFVLSEAMKAGLIVGDDLFVVTPSVSGWNRIEESRRSGTRSRSAFLAVQFDSKIFTQPIENRFKTAALETGYTLSRVDEQPKAGIIDVRIMLAIRESRFAVVELSDGNRGAYWEGGFAEGLDKPAIYLC